MEQNNNYIIIKRYQKEKCKYMCGQSWKNWMYEIFFGEVDSAVLYCYQGTKTDKHALELDSNTNWWAQVHGPLHKRATKYTFLTITKGMLQDISHVGLHSQFSTKFKTWNHDIIFCDHDEVKLGIHNIWNFENL